MFQYQHILPPGTHRCTPEEFSQILAEHRAPRIQGFTRTDIQPAAPRRCPPYADYGIQPLLLPLETKKAVLWRLAEKHYNRWQDASLPITEDGYFIHRLLRELAMAGRSLDLPQIYAVLVRLFGPTSQYKDNWNEGFKIPLLIELEQREKTIFYSLTVVQWKAGLECRFRRQHSGLEHLAQDVYQQPFDAELSRVQLNQCVGFILESCSLVSDDAPEASVLDFHFAVPAGQIAFGCLNGQFYIWRARGESDFQKYAHQPGYCARMAPSAPLRAGD
jgi:hypothetical protein